jgi:ABC-type molybdenum transport system ATPase subunit/photorepair protein PhrA
MAGMSEAVEPFIRLRNVRKAYRLRDREFLAVSDVTMDVRAFIHDPKLILMDEPFVALDALTREQMNLEILRIWRESGKTIVFVTHSIQEAVFLASHCAV